MSAVRLLVLGVVRMHGRAHGYVVRRELLSWSADTWANVQPGSIYHALKKMNSENLLARVDTGDEGRPDKVTYELTADGERYFDQQLAKMLAEVRRDPSANYAFAAAVAFLPTLTRDRAISLLEYRLTQLTGGLANLDVALDHGTDWGQPQHVSALYRLWRAHVETDIGWTEDLLSRLRAGEYVMADDAGHSFGSPDPPK
ncbi:PadR family transcriptional regulator [Saccharomonospora cyanea]|uniref:Putative transcriptional regulator n=1 Tax=Saccharomonospora cyanea NA-134 TaxID=882082 RepID=H5XM61_9PSEU|nr:PadR family transcriptional regulator [Saccharomonospora cyanea]EHR63140.1 putative transcriptional regulator [Saccharomonospora cyanea NA-134]